MSKSKDKAETSAIKYTREKLLKSKALSNYQPDFASVILTDETYTIEEAKALLDSTLAEGGK